MNNQKKNMFNPLDIGDWIEKGGKAIDDVTKTAKDIADVGRQYNQNPEVIKGRTERQRLRAEARQQRQRERTERIRSRNKLKLEKQRIKAEEKAKKEEEKTALPYLW